MLSDSFMWPYTFNLLVLFTVWRHAEIAFGLVLYRVPCQCRALAWPFIVIKENVFCWIRVVFCKMGIKSVVYHGSGRGSLRVKTEECKDHRLYWATPLDRDTAKGYKYRFLFIFFLTACFTSFFSFYNQFLRCVSCCLLACVFDSVLFLGSLISYCRLMCNLF